MMKKVLRYFSVFMVLLVLVGGAGVWFIFTASYSEGTRAGRLVKFSKKGILFKTYEGELNLGGVSSDAGDGVTSLWHFSVDKENQKMIENLDRASGRIVRLHYSEKYVKLFWEGDTRYFIERIEAVE